MEDVAMRFRTRPLSPVVFDLEAQPGPWAGSDWTYRMMLTGALWTEDTGMTYLAPDFSGEELDAWVQPLRAKGTLVVAHNGDKYDLPLLTGTLLKFGLPMLGTVLLSDTCSHLPKMGSALSRKLGDLSARLDLHNQKGSLGPYEWEAVYERQEWALEALEEYNVADVLATYELWKELNRLGWLGPAKSWRARK